MYRLQDELDKARAVARALDSFEIDARARGDHVLNQHWGGVFPSDLLPKKPIARSEKPIGYVANTDPSDQNGSHWVSFYFPKERDDVVEFYDSYGLEPKFYSPYFARFIATHSQECLRTSVDSQGLFSDVCGYYALGYLHMRCLGLSMREIVKKFPENNKRTNDKRIAEYVNEHVPMPRQRRTIKSHVFNQKAQIKRDNHARYNVSR